MLRDYVVLAASGGWVNGQRLAIGATVQLTDAQAEYEVDLGNVRLVGDAAPVVPAILQPGDKLSVLRGAAEHPVTAAEMESYLLGTAARPRRDRRRGRQRRRWRWRKRRPRDPARRRRDPLRLIARTRRRCGHARLTARAPRPSRVTLPRETST